MVAVYDKTTEGCRLIRVTFERRTPEASAPVIEVVYRLDFPGDFRIDSVPVLTFQSATRTDTRRKVFLSDEEETEVQEVATNKAAEAVKDW